MDGTAKITDRQGKNFTGPFFSETSHRFEAIQLYFDIVSPHGNVDSDEYKLLLSNNWSKERDPVKQPQI